jgi:LPXTG-site transpeptidase (sortase) family protein
MSRTVRKKQNDNGELKLKDILNDEGKKTRLYLLILGILLVVWGYSSSRPVSPTLNSTVSVTPQNNTVVSFSQEPVTVDKNLLSDKTKQKNSPVRILIGTLSIDIPVKEAKVVKGYWEVFPDSAGFGVGSAYPDEKGNMVIFAHARDKLFLNLRKIKVGDEITVFTTDKWYKYKVDNLREVFPSQTEVIAPTTEAVLTLYTCTGFSDSKRLIVTSKKIN